MPELPEVETIKRDLQSKVKDLTITDVKVFDRRVIFGLTPQAFIKHLKNKTLSSFDHRGKSLVIGLKPKSFLVVQPKMSGHLLYHSKVSPEITSSVKAVFQLSNGAVLHYNDHRMFGKLYCVDNLSSVKHLGALGPDPLQKEFTVDLLQKILNRRTPVKVALMNQQLVAGIGNIYASESLFDAKIDPRRPGSNVLPAEIKKLHTSIQKILKLAIDSRGSSLRDYRDTSGEQGSFTKRIKVYGKTGQPCPGCKGTIEKIIQAQRSTFFCPDCQT